jgi:undecaprenyl pyrophosphate phosphatase UppP
MPDWIAVIVLGLIEGITEFLPISSTGHLLLIERGLGIKKSDLFNVVIQCGAVLAVLPLFPERLRQFAFRWRSASIARGRSRSSHQTGRKRRMSEVCSLWICGSPRLLSASILLVAKN